MDNDDERVGTCVDIQEGDTVCVAGMQTVEDTSTGALCWTLGTASVGGDPWIVTPLMGGDCRLEGTALVSGD